MPANPDERDKTIVGKEGEKIVVDYIKKHFPLLETEPAITETCMYTVGIRYLILSNLELAIWFSI